MSLLKQWVILCWNIRGINAREKQLALMNAIKVSGCSVICLQETKKEDFDLQFIKSCCPTKFDEFVFVPSVGALVASLLYGIVQFFLEWSCIVKSLLSLFISLPHILASLGH